MSDNINDPTGIHTSDPQTSLSSPKQSLKVLPSPSLPSYPPHDLVTDIAGTSQNLPVPSGPPPFSNGASQSYLSLYQALAAEELSASIFQAGISVAPDDTFIETSSGQAAYELKKRFDYQCGVGREFQIRSIYALTSFVNQYGKTMYRVSFRDAPAPAAAALAAENIVSVFSSASNATASNHGYPVGGGNDDTTGLRHPSTTDRAHPNSVAVPNPNEKDSGGDERVHGVGVTPESIPPGGGSKDSQTIDSTKEKASAVQLDAIESDNDSIMNMSAALTSTLKKHQNARRGIKECQGNVDDDESTSPPEEDSQNQGIVCSDEHHDDTKEHKRKRDVIKALCLRHFKTDKSEEQNKDTCIEENTQINRGRNHALLTMLSYVKRPTPVLVSAGRAKMRVFSRGERPCHAVDPNMELEYDVEDEPAQEIPADQTDSSGGEDDDDDDSVYGMIDTICYCMCLPWCK